MTDREKAIVMAYTGYCMLAGDKLSVFYEYVESIMGRPVYTHEMGTKVVDDLIKEKARPDFIALCKEDGAQIDNLEDIADMIVIWKGVTNGKVMKAVFPKAKVSRYIDEYERPSDYLIHIDDETYFTKEWWNAPYKGGAE